MNADKKTIGAARAKAMMSTPLRKELKEWFSRKENCPYPEITDFQKWLEKELDFLALMIADKNHVTAENLFTALWVEAIGDKNATRIAESARDNGFKTDTCCYVEDGKVFSSVWLSGTDAEKTLRRAEYFATKFREMGYTLVDTHVDEEDNKDVTVCAVIDFPAYAAIVTKKGGK